MENGDSVNLTILGEFREPELEREYNAYDMRISLKYFEPMMIVCGIAHALFLIPDYILLNNPKAFAILIILRLFFLSYILGVYIRKDSLVMNHTLYCWVSLGEIGCSVGALLLLFYYQQPNFIVLTFGIMLLILAIFAVPNRLRNMVLISLVLLISYQPVSLVVFRTVDSKEFLGMMAFIFILYLFAIVQSYRINYYKRVQYMGSKRLSMLASIDSLTEISNRLRFNEELPQYIEMARRYRTNLSLIIFDFDNFKRINDQYGHLMGDQILVDISNLVKDVVRKADLLARWGGEEFVILLPNTDGNGAVEIVERIRRRLKDYRFGAEECITCSFGVATLNDGDDPHSFVQRADQKLYEAKRLGKNRVAY